MIALRLAAALLGAQVGQDAPRPPPVAAPAPPAQDLHAGHAGHAKPVPAPASAAAVDNAPPPTDHAAQRDYDAKAMAAARAILRKEHGGGTYSLVSVPIVEYQSGRGRDGYRWNGEAWYGGDRHRLVLKSEGGGRLGEGAEAAEVQLLYARPVDAYWNLQAGARQDLGRGTRRSYAVLAAEGLAPYWLAVEGALFLSSKGELNGRVEASYDQRITQRLILQPRLELSLAAQQVRAQGIGSGLVDAEADLRLRYAIVPEFAPYIGVSHQRRFGDTRRFARAAGEDGRATRLVVGVAGFF